jgi:hypothetical protein
MISQVAQLKVSKPQMTYFEYINVHSFHYHLGDTFFLSSR